jgi:phosphoribosyl 1,2-cyclic phosphate phosphodiesterase
MNLEQALALIEELKPKRAFITHISHRMGLHDKVNQDLPKGVQLAFDGLEFEL